MKQITPTDILAAKTYITENVKAFKLNGIGESVAETEIHKFHDYLNAHSAEILRSVGSVLSIGGDQFCATKPEGTIEQYAMVALNIVLNNILKSVFVNQFPWMQQCTILPVMVVLVDEQIPTQMSLHRVFPNPNTLN